MALVMGIAGLVISANQYRRIQAQMAWPATPGTVTALKSWTAATGRDRSVSIQMPTCHYQYQGSNYTAEPPLPYRLKTQDVTMLQNLATDSVIPLHINPSNPEDIALVFPSLEGIRLTMILFGVFLAFGIGFLARGITLRDTPDPTAGKRRI